MTSGMTTMVRHKHPAPPPNTGLRVLVIGGGGREHALCVAIKKSPLCEELFCAPGNAGIAHIARCDPLDVTDFGAIIKLCKEEKINFVIVGPEAPLVAGLVDVLHDLGIAAFGPTEKAAMLEGSKAFMKKICDEHGIPTARYVRLNDPDKAKTYAESYGAPMVIKADGLAAGKGVVVAHNMESAYIAIDQCLSEKKFGKAGAEIIIEEFMEGEEISVFALLDGESEPKFLGCAQDHKQAHNGDKGPNTGGMGAYSPAPALTPELQNIVMQKMIWPAQKALAMEGTPFRGILFAGLMLTEDGPKLLEFNVRFGDPEAQAVLPRLKSDLLALMAHAARGTNEEIGEIEWDEQAALCVVMAAKGYPGDYEKDTPISGLEEAAATPDIHLYHAATREDNDKILANGGRVLGITALGESITAAQQKAYDTLKKINWPEGFYRTDIGWRAIEQEKKGHVA